MIEINKVPKKFKSKARHIIFNWQESPNMVGDEKLVRYHFVICDDKYREGKVEKIIQKFRDKSFINYSFEEIRKAEGKVEGTDFRYLFVTYDTQYSPKLLNFESISDNVKQDVNLRERKKGNIEDYVANLYSKKD